MNINVTLLAQVIAFALLIWFINKYLWIPITDMLAARQKRIADGLADGDKGRQALNAAEQEVEALLAKTRMEAQDLLAAAQKRASSIEEEARQKAKGEAVLIKEAAKAEVDQEVVRAREYLRKQIAQITVAGASKILNKEVDSQVHSALLDDLARQI